MTGRHDDYLVGWAEGKGRNLAKGKNITAAWGELKRKLSKPLVTPETRKAFDKMSKDEQDELKALPGWISGAQCKDGYRRLANVMPRDLLTLDCDYMPEGIVEDIKLGAVAIAHYEGFWHSSRRHTEEAPRLRFFAPLSRKVDRDEYVALVRFVAWRFDHDMKLVDQVSFRPAQMMFKPSCSRTDEKHFVAIHQPGDILDVDAELAAFTDRFGDWRDLANLPRHPDEHDLRKRADKAEDPREKRGPVGTFCRAYDIEAAMSKFIPDAYIPGDSDSGNPRYTYAGSTSSNGAVVYDGGLFLYSHHGHDPVCDMNVNAFDLVRIHLYGDKDEKVREGTNPTDFPSYRAMVEMLSDDKGYRKQQAEDKYDMHAMFEDAGITEEEDDEDGRSGEPDDEADEAVSGGEDDDYFDADLFADLVGDPSDAPRRQERKSKANGKRQARPKNPRKDWFPGDLELNNNGDIVPNLHNAATIIQNDARLFGSIAFNAFAAQVVARADIRSKMHTVPDFICQDRDNGDRWQDFNDISIRAIMEAPNGPGKVGYGMKVTDRDLSGGVMLAARQHQFHPVQDYLHDCHERWDGERGRVDSMLIRYFGVPDTAYHRQIARMALVASVVRIFEPGHKFDFAIIIQGLQGVGKSTFIKFLYSTEWFGEIDCDLSDRQAVAEQIAGKWGLELPEMSSFHKADHNAAKQFMRREHDDVRMAYGRHVMVLPRQCVFWGTTNEKKIFKDGTGNRSYWPITATVETVDTDALLLERDALWGEAMQIYLDMRAAKPKGTLFLALNRDAEMEARAKQEDMRMEELHEEWALRIMAWADEPVTLEQWRREMGLAPDDKFATIDDEEDPSEVWVVRTIWRQEDAVRALLGDDTRAAASPLNKNIIERAYPLLKGWVRHGATSVRRLGIKARWWEREEAKIHEREQGFRRVPAPHIVAEDPTDGLI